MKFFSVQVRIKVLKVSLKLETCSTSDRLIKSTRSSLVFLVLKVMALMRLMLHDPVPKYENRTRAML